MYMYMCIFSLLHTCTCKLNLTQLLAASVPMYVSSLVQKFDARSRLTAFACLEIHVTPSQGEGPALYRVFSQHGTLEKKDPKVRSEARSEGEWIVCLFEVISLVSTEIKASEWYRPTKSNMQAKSRCRLYVTIERITGTHVHVHVHVF